MRGNDKVSPDYRIGSYMRKPLIFNVLYVVSRGYYKYRTFNKL